jgi:hypothetical protein
MMSRRQSKHWNREHPGDEPGDGVMMSKADLRGKVPESWACIDCGINTAPSVLNRKQMEHAFALDWEKKGVALEFSPRSEVYHVKEAVWKAASMEPYDGWLCIGCLEKRLGRTLTPRDFVRNHPFNSFPATERLRSRRGTHSRGTVHFASRKET